MDYSKVELSTDSDRADAFAARFKDQLSYCEGLGWFHALDDEWMDGDPEKVEVYRLLRQMGLEIRAHAASVGSVPKRTVLLRHANRFLNYDSMGKILRLASKHPSIRTSVRR